MWTLTMIELKKNALGWYERARVCDWERMGSTQEALLTAFFNLPGFDDGPMVIRVVSAAPQARTRLYLRDAFGNWTAF